VQQLKSSTCSLDILPTTFLKGVFSSLTEDLLHIVNCSLLSGIFPTSLKTAVVRPLLKKKNLDTTLLNNYRPISNLPFISKVIGSILGPLLFNLYMFPLRQILQDCGVPYHIYADDTQIYLALSPSDYGPVDSLCLCLEKVIKWMLQNFLQLNKDKTEIIISGE
ncbi:hypothetical protein LDENG_00192120, partial [Lucifuga dentata]